MADEKSLTVKRTINADPQTIYRALTEEGLMEKWFFAGPDGWSATVKNDAREGGHYRVEMHGENDTYTHTGTYREVVPNEKLVFTWNSRAVKDTLVTIALREVGEGTEVELTHDFMPDKEMVDNHTEGWKAILQRLEGVAEELQHG